MITWNDFEKLDIRSGTILQAEHFAEARKPSYKLLIDFGEIGTLRSSAQITELYNLDDLIGMQIVAIVNLGKKQIANFISECLILGVYNEENKVVLLQPTQAVGNGCKIG